MNSHRVPASGVTEREFQQQIIDLARALGWLVYHTHDSRKSEPGFPDLVLVRDRIVYLELKTETGKVSLDQQHWIAALTVAGATALVVRPSDFDRVKDALSRPAPEKQAA